MEIRGLQKMSALAILALFLVSLVPFAGAAAEQTVVMATGDVTAVDVDASSDISNEVSATTAASNLSATTATSEVSATAVSEEKSTEKPKTPKPLRPLADKKPWVNQVKIDMKAM
ncbi:hypothetical protein HZB03_00260, partial [Candidatus Woesearchaeota archaeon]|nr:hypothetical protein [Candidatus Woesearchaeota archaeon]